MLVFIDAKASKRDSDRLLYADFHDLEGKFEFGIKQNNPLEALASGGCLLKAKKLFISLLFG